MTEIKVSEYGEIINRCKRSKEEIITDIEKETNSKYKFVINEFITHHLFCCNNDWEFQIYKNHKSLLEKNNEWLFTHYSSSLDLKTMQLITEFMEVLENE